MLKRASRVSHNLYATWRYGRASGVAAEAIRLGTAGGLRRALRACEVGAGGRGGLRTPPPPRRRSSLMLEGSLFEIAN